MPHCKWVSGRHNPLPNHPAAFGAAIAASPQVIPAADALPFFVTNQFALCTARAISGQRSHGKRDEQMASPQ